MLAELLGLVAPPRCALCARSCLAPEVVCDRCEARLRALRPRFVRAPGLDAAWSASAYEGLTRELVMALKFGARLQLAGRAAVAIADSAPADLLRGVIVPVPAAPARRRRRGFDAAEEIAAALAASAGLEARRCLRRAQGGVRSGGRGRSGSPIHRASRSTAPRPSERCWSTTSSPPAPPFAPARMPCEAGAPSGSWP
ncbi:MAG TPA: hypothetical protein VKG89_02375 [Solirubrobacterales bacterium]|nr:hypothetical protein [Solirubrobacterales bacterium]